MGWPATYAHIYICRRQSGSLALSFFLKYLRVVSAAVAAAVVVVASVAVLVSTVVCVYVMVHALMLLVSVPYRENGPVSLIIDIDRDGDKGSRGQLAEGNVVFFLFSSPYSHPPPLLPSIAYHLFRFFK
ncbi:hypothetical protein F4810DRAFT_697061 [Camillea tinctor]|nr:hypothetical protein F4810DRAFT_697061 [Camillea tinctor]